MRALLSTDAYLLRSVAVGERDLIVTLLTESRGKLSAVARGGRGSRRRFAGALEPLQRIQVDLTHPDREIATLTEARIAKVFPAVAEDLDRLEAAGRALRWSRHVLPPRVPEPEVWTALETLFSSLEGAVNGAPLLFAFGLALLQVVGVGIGFDRCGVCGKARPPGRPAHFDVARGGVVCASCGGARKVLEGALLDALDERARASVDAATTGLELIEAALAVHTAYDEKRD